MDAGPRGDPLASCSPRLQVAEMGGDERVFTDAELAFMYKHFQEHALQDSTVPSQEVRPPGPSPCRSTGGTGGRLVTCREVEA
jgi:hypothetical protein